MRRSLLVACALAASCSRTPELQLTIRMPPDRTLLAGVTQVNLTASRDRLTLAAQSFPAGTTDVALAGVPYGPRTVIALDGVTPRGDVIGHGQSCPVDFEGPGASAAIYFAPTNAFEPTAGGPTLQRSNAVAVSVADGTVLLAGGDDGGGAVSSTEVFSPGSGAFSSPGLALGRPRARAQAVSVAGVGTLVVGGVDDRGAPLGDGEVWNDAAAQFVPLANEALGARVGHRAVELPDSRVLVTGGASGSAAALATTALLSLLPDGTATVAPGPSLLEARREHAMVVAVGVPVVIGGYGLDGKALSSLEAMVPASILGGPAFVSIASLRFPRAEATATVLDDGSILVAGGVDGTGAPRGDAEVYNPITRATALYSMVVARRGHTATLLADGRVLIVGGLDGAGQPLDRPELFAPGVGFVSERKLSTPRAGHVAVGLCDGTVLIAGGGAGAELYNPPR